MRIRTGLGQVGVTKPISQVEALIYLSESTENQAGVINAIINGIDLLN